MPEAEKDKQIDALEAALATERQASQRWKERYENLERTLLDYLRAADLQQSDGLCGLETLRLARMAERLRTELLEAGLIDGEGKAVNARSPDYTANR